jgi:hypothetical protein
MVPLQFAQARFDVQFLEIDSSMFKITLTTAV